MMDPSLPVAILYAALALMLGFVPRKTAAASLLVAGSLTFAVSQIDWSAAIATPAITGCWVGVLVLAVWIYWPKRLGNSLAIALAAAAGIIAGIVVGSAATPFNPYPLVAAVLLVVPASVAVERGYAIAPRVVASWLVAVSLLAALLPFVVSHPGYVPDHRG